MRNPLFVPIMVSWFLVLGCAKDSGLGPDRPTFQRDVHSQIERIIELTGEQFVDVSRQTEELPDDARSAVERKIDALESQRMAWQGKLDEMKSASARQWEGVKVDIERAFQALRQSSAIGRRNLEESIQSSERT